MRNVQGIVLAFVAAASLRAQSAAGVQVIAADGTPVAVTGENGARVANSMILYNPNWGYTTGTNAFGAEVVLSPARQAQQYTVSSVNSYAATPNASGNSAIGDGLVLSGAPGAQAQLLSAHFKAGDQVQVLRPITKQAARTANGVNAVRQTNYLIIFTPAFGATTNTNSFGYEAVVENGVVTKVGGNNSAIPANGFVLSGHGTSNDWLSTNAIVGTRASFSGLDVTLATDASSYVFQGRLAVDNARAAMQQAWNDYVPAPLEKAKVSLAEAQKVLARANAAAGSDPPQAVLLAQEATTAANAAFFYTLPGRVAEARGTWYRPVEKNLDQVKQTLDHMAEGHFNELYIETWFQGYTIYPSAVLAANGIVNQSPTFSGFDPLRAFADEGRKRGIAVHAWIDGFFVGTDTTGGPVLRAHPEWAARVRTQADNNTPTPDPATGYFWLDIINPEVRKFLLDLSHEMVAQYGLAGIDLDYMRFPVAADWTKSFGFTPYARQAYQAYSGIDPYTINATTQPAEWKAWTQWLSDTEDDYVRRVYPDMKTISRNVVVSATPEPGAESDQIGRWSQYVDTVIPQAYSLGSVPPLVTETDAELSPGNLIYAGIYPFYHHESAELTVAEVMSGRELVSGTNIFAFGQANAPAITALTQGPWRDEAVSTGMHPVAATAAQLRALAKDISDVYLPRQAMTKARADAFEAAAKSIMEKLNGPAPDVIAAKAGMVSLRTEIQSGGSGGEIKAVVAGRIATTLAGLERVLLYAQVKGIR